MSYCFPKSLLTFLGTVMLLTGCSQNSVSNQTISEQKSPSTEPQSLDLMVSIAPQKYFVEKIGGDRLKINVMVDPQTEPETYEPKPQQLATLSEIEAYISIGLPFEEKWLHKFKEINPQMMMIDSAKGIERLGMSDHSHDHGTENSTHSNLDPHIWLSPSLVKIQAQNIYEGLSKLDPQNQATYQKNLQEFLTEIDQLNQKINDNLAGITNRKFIVFHPAWTYFAKEYNLEQIPVEVEGQEPSASELAQLIQTAKNSNIKVIFVQPEFKTKNAQAIAQEIGGQVIMITPNDPQWAENLLKVSEIFKLNLSVNSEQ